MYSIGNILEALGSLTTNTLIAIFVIVVFLVGTFAFLFAMYSAGKK